MVDCTAEDGTAELFKKVDSLAESHDTHNTDNMDSAVELNTVLVVNEGK